MTGVPPIEDEFAYLDRLTADPDFLAFVRERRRLTEEAVADLPPLVAQANRAAIALSEVDRVARQGGEHFAARGMAAARRAGCHWCCSHKITVSAGEALLIADALHGDTVGAAKVRKQARNNRGLEQMDFVRRGTFCPFLTKDRRCGIYPVRPAVCRSFASIDAAACKEAWRVRTAEIGAPRPGWMAMAAGVAAFIQADEPRGELCHMVVKALPLVPLFRLLLAAAGIERRAAEPAAQAMPSAAL